MEAVSLNANTDTTEAGELCADSYLHSVISMKPNVEDTKEIMNSLVPQDGQESEVCAGKKSVIDMAAENEVAVDDEKDFHKADDDSRSLEAAGDHKLDVDRMDLIKHKVDDTVDGSSEWEDHLRQHQAASDSCDSKDVCVNHDSLNGDSKDVDGKDSRCRGRDTPTLQKQVVTMDSPIKQLGSNCEGNESVHVWSDSGVEDEKVDSAVTATSNTCSQSSEDDSKKLDKCSKSEGQIVVFGSLENDKGPASDVESGISKDGGSSVASSTRSEGQTNEKPIKFKCLKCSRVMKDKRLIENHACEGEVDEEKVKITIMFDKNKQGLVCQECDYTSTGHNFEEHLMCHLMVRPYQCLYCKECFINRKEISRHVVKSHNGAKMSCALRALKKAKSLIREVTTSGVISFMARVAGKVPLERDPDKKKLEDSKTGQYIQDSNRHDDIQKSNNNDHTIKEAIVTGQSNPGNTLKEASADHKLPDAATEKLNPSVSALTCGMELETSQSGKDHMLSESELSKAIEDTTTEFAFSESKISNNGEVSNSPQAEITSNSCKSKNEFDLKIVASFTLQDMDECAEEKDMCPIVTQPNFVMSPPTSKDATVLSFLGPDRPVFKSNDDICLPMLPPPPLQHALIHSPVTTNQAADYGFKQTVKNSHFFVCGFNCLFSSMSTSDFLEHTVNFHSSETYFPCFYCGHRSPNETDLVRHISNHTQTHSNSMSLFVCANSGCPFGTNMVADYINHMKTSHADVLELVCHSCGDRFPEANMLQTHIEDNIIHIVNCPHCSSKATDRKAILNHISSVHPGKPKMVSVAKQLICHDRKVNGYEQMVRLQEMLPPALTPAPSFAAGSSVIDQILSSHSLAGSKPAGKHLPEVSTCRSNPSPRDMQSPSGDLFLHRQKEATPDSGRSPVSESSDMDSMKVKEEISEEAEGYGEFGGADDSRNAYVVDENGIRRRVYVPMSERRAENYRCKHCTFIARDNKRMHCHERSHGMPPTRKERFKCMFCPQGFDSELKFRLHITCHPGLIKFLLYRCKKCEFDTNQKHIIVRHITCNRDRKHRGFGPLEDQYTVVSRSLESRVLECERCDYMTRHKIHMTIHYQRKHNILKDKGDFTIENLMPTDTPLVSPASHDVASSLSSSSAYKNFNSPGSYHDDTFDFTKPSGSAKKSKDKNTSDSNALTPTQITERNEVFHKMVSQQAALQPGPMMENQMRKFKCPICKYLLPKAADLKNHVKRHSEIGQITLVMFRCKYCSCMSTARELLYEHLTDKHPGKPIALVKKIVVIDTADVDKSFAETSVEESLDQLEESLQREMISSLNSASSSGALSCDQVFVLPEEEDTFKVPLQCPKCSYDSYSKADIIEHISSIHPEVKVIGSDEDVDNLARATRKGSQQEPKQDKYKQNSPVDVLILPDDQVFNEPALCSQCDFTTMIRRDLVTHLQQNHPEISVMGRNSYPVQVSAIEQSVEPLDESCVVGSGSLDAKVRCLYENYGNQMKCLICGAERPKKFFIHVHILRHLNIYLWKCTFCAHRGLQKYKMIDHIKKLHPGKPLSVHYLRVNVEEKVSQFLSQFSVIKSRKASLDEGSYVPFTSDDMSDQASSDSSRSRQKSPGPGGDTTSAHSLGSDELDQKICCMYENFNDVHFKCRVCPYQFQRKFAMHRHIIISHLKVALLSCAYCGMEGVERHQLVDHILTCHKPAPISIHTLDIDLHKMASDFLAKMTARAQQGSFGLGYSGTQEEGGFSFPSSTLEDGDSYSLEHNPNKKLKFNSLKYSKFMKPPAFRFGNKIPSKGIVKKTRAVDPDVIMLGRHALDKKLSCLYQQRPTGQLRCLVCRWEFPRKYPLHRHIMLRHLRTSLVGCPYCPFEGIEKYNVTTHIRETHKDKPINIKFTQPDVDAKVRQFVDNMANIGGKGQEDLIQKPQPRRKALQKMLKDEKQSGDEMDNNNNDDDYDEDDDDEENISSRRPSHSGLVVAMFGKKKQSNDFVVKTEIDDDNIEEGSPLETNDEEKGDVYSRVEKSAAGDSTSKPSAVSSPLSFKHVPEGSFTPGAYRSPAGGKAKALDVITKIKVLKTKEGPIMKFYCEKCNFTSLHRSNIVRHIYKIHEKYQTQTCPMCNYQTLSAMLMERHREKAHRSGQPKAVPAVPNSYNQPLKGNQGVKKKIKSLTSKKSQIKTDAESLSYTGPKNYACAYCHYETNTQADILQHTRDNHSQGDYSASEDITSAPVESDAVVKVDDAASACWDGSKKAVKRKWQEEEEGVYKRKRRFIFEKGNELIQCGHCETKETSMSRIQDHITWDHPGLPFQAKQIPAWRFLCKACSVKTMATSKMKYHLNRHINYRPYTCVTCGAFFPSPDQCRRHSRSQAHEEQYTYVRNPKKESKVEELLEGTRQLALKVQEEAAKCPDFDMSRADNFISKFQESRSNLKKNLQGKVKKAAAAEASQSSQGEGADMEQKPQKKQTAKSPQTLGVEQEITIKCYYCEFTSSNVSSVSIHHKEAHPGKKFLWTELERGFTCDSTGEALKDCDSVPGASMDVGYTTRMTLGSGSNTMRFKCKTCDFSSFVIQAMKSHLKSHQPKGFICPYCSRSFSGKEKLMRHQYCLHKGQPLWVIHLRKLGVIGSHSVKKCKGVTGEDDEAAAQEETTLQEEGIPDEEKDGSEKSAVKKTSQTAATTYFCNECSFSSESMYDFRRHLAQQHQAFRHKVQDKSGDESVMKCGYCPFLTKSEAELLSHVETHFTVDKDNFQCSYCDYVADNRSSVQQHLASEHSSLDPKMSEIGSRESQKNLERKDVPLLLNLKPSVAVERIPESLLTLYGYQASKEADDISEDEKEDDHLESPSVSPSVSSDESTQQPRLSEAALDSNSNDERVMTVGEISNLHAIDNDDGDNSSSSMKSLDGENESEEDVTSDNFDSNLNAATDCDELARELGLVEDETSCVLGSDADMMIMQFGGIVDDKGNDLPNEANEIDRDESDDRADEDMDDDNVEMKSPNIQSSSSVFCSKDSTLFAAQKHDDDEENNDEDDGNDELAFGSDILLASPLPMISLGDAVSMSPMNVQSKEADNLRDDSAVSMEKQTSAMDVDSNSEMLLDM